MSTIIPGVILVSLAGLAACYLTIHLPKAKKKKQAMKQWADQRGFDYQADFDSSPQETFAPLRLFCLQPTGGRLSHVMRCSRPVTWLFEHEYSIHRDQNVRQSVAAFQMSHQYEPLVIQSRKRERFTVAAMRIFTAKLANWQHNYREIDCSEDRHFSKQYRLFSASMAPITCDTITQKARAHLAKQPGWNLEVHGHWLLVYREGILIKPAHLDAFLKSATGLCNLLDLKKR